MSQRLLAHSPDLKRLQDEGYELEIKGAIALVHHVPYVNSSKQIGYGTLVSELTLSGDITQKPNTHVIHFMGSYPCDKYGNRLVGISHQSETRNLGEGITIQHSFSNKPLNGYKDYYEKFVQYITIISSPAISLDHDVTAQTYFVPCMDDSNVFEYEDTNSARSNIGAISEKLKGQRIGIIGLGGTGSYILDYIAKTPVDEIHLFDGDLFVQHNAFRAPGAPTKEELCSSINKTDYFCEKYLKMHKNIYSHSEYIDEDNLEKVQELTFVFICIDKGTPKKLIISYLAEHNIPFIDVGIGLEVYDNTLLGQIRTTIGEPNTYMNVKRYINYTDDEEEGIYKTNIQIAEINAFNASLAVIQWKKQCGYYQDVSHSVNVIYSINDGELFNEARMV